MKISNMNKLKIKLYFLRKKFSKNFKFWQSKENFNNKNQKKKKKYLLELLSNK